MGILLCKDGLTLNNDDLKKVTKKTKIVFTKYNK